MYTQDIVDSLREQSTKKEPMVPTTVRLPSLLEEEIRDFCASNKVNLAVILRECIQRGWDQIQSGTDRGTSI